MNMWLHVRLIYADGDADATLLRPRRWSYAFDALLYPFYIKSEVHLIYVPLNVNDRRDQVAMLQLAIMNLDDRRSRQDGVGGPKGPGSVDDYPQTDGYNVDTMATYINKSNAHGRWLFILQLHENGAAQNWS